MSNFCKIKKSVDIMLADRDESLSTKFQRYTNEILNEEQKKLAYDVLYYYNSLGTPYTERPLSRPCETEFTIPYMELIEDGVMTVDEVYIFNYFENFLEESSSVSFVSDVERVTLTLKKYFLGLLDDDEINKLLDYVKENYGNDDLNVEGKDMLHPCITVQNLGNLL